MNARQIATIGTITLATLLFGATIITALTPPIIYALGIFGLIVLGYLTVLYLRRYTDEGTFAELRSVWDEAKEYQRQRAEEYDEETAGLHCVKGQDEEHRFEKRDGSIYCIKCGATVTHEPQGSAS